MLTGQGTCILAPTPTIFTVFLNPLPCYIEQYAITSFTYLTCNRRVQGHGVHPEGVENADAVQYGIPPATAGQEQFEDDEFTQFFAGLEIRSANGQTARTQGVGCKPTR